MAGIKEIKELVAGANELAVVLIELLKDGVQIHDATDLATKLISDSKFRQALEDAVKGMSLVNEEAKDIDSMEALELARLQMSYVGRLIEAAKKKA